MTAKQTPVVVKPGQVIEVAFNGGPSPKRTKTEPWQTDETKKTIRRKKEQLTVPDQKGVFICYV